MEEMAQEGPAVSTILQELHAKRSTRKERERKLEQSIREEAINLREQGGDRISWCSMHEKGLQRGRDFPTLDLEQLVSHQEDLLMANQKLMMPDKSYTVVKKGYEEFHVPHMKPKLLAEGEALVRITDLFDWAQAAFNGLKTLNRVQSRVYETALFTPENLLLCAPTGAGKTNVAMLTILREIGLHRRKDGALDLNGFKVVYVAPMKALVAEIVGNLSDRLESYGITVQELTGDQTLSGKQIEETQVIVTTPEKWDIITRKSGERSYSRKVSLLILDEVHLLHDNRGPVLESIVARTVRQIEATHNMIRLVGLSATLPNYEDVAVFLRVDRVKGLFCFDNSYRPCPLSQQYIGITARKAATRFQLMNDICAEKVLAAAGNHQVLVFVHSRKETARTAHFIRDKALRADMIGHFLKEGSASWKVLQTETEAHRNNDLRDLLPYGLAIHHAGMTRLERTIIEELFAEGHIRVLVSTATLAWGVNLPAHTVVIKGTQIYNPEKGAWSELSFLDVMQMLGRAGRPQFDTYGEGIIITGQNQLHWYCSFMNQQMPIESQFISRLADSLNAEIVLGTVQSLEEACTWLGYTYLYIRMLRNPVFYGISMDALKSDKFLENRRTELIHSAASTLEKDGLINYDRKTGLLQATYLGRIASFYYITHGTMAIFNEQLKPTMGDIGICHLFSLVEEFKLVTVRQEEKMELSKLLERVPIPVKDTLEDPQMKINVLLQAYISQLRLEGLSLASDMVFVSQSCGRLMRSLVEIVLKKGWAQLAEKALTFSKMVQQRMWSSQSPLRQFRSVRKDILLKLEKKNLAWEHYYDFSAHELGELVKAPKQGKILHKLIHQVPKLDLAVCVLPITRSVLKVDLKITPDFLWDEKVHGCAEPFWIIVEDHDGERILHYQYFVLKMQHVDEDHSLSFTVPIMEPMPPHYYIRILSDRWLGSDATLPVSFKHVQLPEKSLPPTELLDLQPLPIAALRNPAFEMLYQRFSYFNSLQTQVFNVLYNTDDSALIAAPIGSGKTICSEFAVMRMLKEECPEKSGARCVYIAPVEALAKERYCDWEAKFGKGLGCTVSNLTGNTGVDLEILKKSQIIISTPEMWDSLSRRWKQQKQVRQSSLLIVDEAHLLESRVGSVLEIIISRTRLMSSMTGKYVRFVALSSPVANAKDMGEWIGASSRNHFNIAPSVGPNPLDIVFQGIDSASIDTCLQSMIRFTHSSIVQQTPARPALVFVPSRKQAQLTASELIAYSCADGRAKSHFLHCEKSFIEPFLEKISDVALGHALSEGVGYLHEHLSDVEQEIVCQLFMAGAIQVCVASHKMCWGLTLVAPLVVVMGTEHFDGQETTHRDYPISDLLQILGRARQPSASHYGKCIFFCHAPKLDYYKKFLCEPLPVESHLDYFLHDHLNAEIAAGTIKNKQDAVDFLTWTYMYRRLPRNPNYYNLQGTGHRHLSEHLSELVETILYDLEASHCIEIVDEMDIQPLSCGLIASYHYITYTTVERFGASLTANTKLRGILGILASASEYSTLPVRPGEEEKIRKLMNHQRFGISKPKYSEPHVKVNVLLQSHFSRNVLGPAFSLDQKSVLLDANRLVQAMVDVISSNDWLSPALVAMEMSQMVTQGLWEKDSALMQLPHFTEDHVKRCQDNPGSRIKTVFELVQMEDNERRRLLQMTDAQLLDVARACNRFPDIDVMYEIVGKEEITAGGHVIMQVSLERELGSNQEVGPVNAPRFPKPKQESWWLVIGDPQANHLLAIKKVSLQRKAQFKLKFSAPRELGKKSYTLYLMCDAYLGCDQEYEFSIDVQQPEDKIHES